MIVWFGRRYLDLLGSIYIYNEHRGYTAIDRVLDAVKGLAARKCGGVVIFSAGFAEGGEEDDFEYKGILLLAELDKELRSLKNKQKEYMFKQEIVKRYIDVKPKTTDREYIDILLNINSDYE